MKKINPVKRIVRNLRQLLPYLPSSAKRYMVTYSISSSMLSLLDIAALMILALSMTSMMKGDPIPFPIIGDIQPAGYVAVVGVVAALIFSKSLLVVLQQWQMTRRFADFELQLGTKLFNAYIRAPWIERLGRTTSQVVRMSDVGIAAINAGFLLPLTSMPALVVTSISIITVLFITDPLTAALTLAYLGLIAALLYFVLSKRTVEAGRIVRDYSFKVASLMTDMVTSMKEITLRGNISEVADVVEKNRQKSTSARANLTFMGVIPKFVLDAALVGGFLLIGGAAYLSTGKLDAAVTAVAMFAIAGVRLIPTLTGFQGLVNQINANFIQVENVLGDLRDAERYIENAEILGKEALEGEPKVLRLRNVSFTYPSRDIPALRGVTFDIPMGSTLGLVGESGSGKTTLVDVILGLLPPEEGNVYLDNQNLSDVLGAWRSRVGYVPQEVALFDGSIAQNVALSWSGNIDYDKVEDSLRKAQMWDTVMGRESGVNTKVGERGMAFSGGQRQRLGIARALYTDPLVLILDEATSALDTRTEADVTEALNALQGKVTIISVAHRLTTIRNADKVCYFESGLLRAEGSFDQVVAAVPSFSEQARLAGLLS